jgi:hypothetical protein
MPAILDLVSTLLRALGVHTEPWVLPAVGFAVVLVLSPFALVNQRTARARRVLQRAAQAGGAERERLEREAMAEVAGRPDGLIVIAEDALKAGRGALAREAVAQLRATGKRPSDLRRLERELDGPAQAAGPKTPLEAALKVERLLAAGMREPAREALEAARRKWPEDADLAGMEIP